MAAGIPEDIHAGHEEPRSTCGRRGLHGRRVDLVQQVQYLTVWWDVSHGVTVVHEARRARPIDEYLSGHPAELEEVHFLAVELQDGGRGVGEADEGKVVFAPVGREGLCAFGPYDDDLAIPL